MIVEIQLQDKIITHVDNMPNFFTKRNLIIALVIIIAIGAIIIWYFARPAPGEEAREEEGFFARLFPGGGERELTEAERKRLEEAQREGAVPKVEKPAARKLVAEPVSGATFVKNPSTGSGRVRYIERETGHVYEIDLNGGDKTRISNTTIPGIFEVIWAEGTGRAILKYASEGRLSILSARFTASTTQGVFLPSDIKDVVFSPRAERLAYVIPARPAGGPSGEETLIVSATPDNKNQRTLFRSAFSSWRLYWPEDATLYLLPSPSAYNDGFLYRLNLATGALSKILGPRLGLAISTDGKNLIFSESDRANKTVLSSLSNLANPAITPLNLKIIPEKCAWSKKEKNVVFCALSLPFPQATHPDDWYKGRVSFTDILVKINTKELSAGSFILEESPDALNLFLSEDEKNLFYINRRDGSLWKVEI